MQIPLILLAGGQGTRLRSIQPELPKPMVRVAGKPFLEWLVAHYFSLGYRRFIFSTCYKAEAVEGHGWRTAFPGADFRYCRENTPLGTGGAVHAIFESQGLESAWVMNGDTLLPAPLPSPPNEVEALFTALRPTSVFDAGPNLPVESGKVHSSGTPTLFDAGAVFVTKRAVSRFRGAIPCSLQELLAPSISLGKVACRVVDGTCYDIGTPERLRRFEGYLRSKTREVGER